MTDQRLGTLVRQLQRARPSLLAGGELVISEARMLAAATMPVGANLLAADVSGFVAVTGLIVVRIDPATHNTFSWYPSTTGIVFNNGGVSQTVNVTYYVTGT